MPDRVVPMIHVPDVKATAEWYKEIGFSIDDTYGEDGEGLSFAILSFGESQLMFNCGGQPSSARRREVDLYVYTNNVDALHERLKDRVDVVEAPHDTFYGMREVIIRDINRFWLTFGQPSAFEILMSAVHAGNSTAVRDALAAGKLSGEALTAALASASTGESKNDEVAELLLNAGASAPAPVNSETLASYEGDYRNPKGLGVEIAIQEGRLVATPLGQRTLDLVPLNERKFLPAAFENVSLTFNVENGKTTSLTFSHGGIETELEKLTRDES